MGAPKNPGRPEALPPTYAERVRQQLRVRCVNLLTKEAYTGEPAPHETEFDADGPIWWCDQTGAALGPDGATADEAGCHGACPRSCYVLPTRPSM